MNSEYYKITQDSIDRVPRARIFGNKIDSYIQDACKKVLELSMNRRDGYVNDEVGMLIDLSGNKYCCIYGYEGILNCNCDKYIDDTVGKPVNSRIFIHNHPNNSQLSLNDLIEMLTCKCVVGSVAVGNHGGISYAYKITDDCSRYALIGVKISMHMSKIFGTPDYEQEEERLRLKILNNPDRYGLKVGYSRYRRSK